MKLENHLAQRPNDRNEGTGRRFQIRKGPAGIHLFNRSIGTNLLLNEVCIPPHLWSKAPRNVSIALTNACDLHCPYCYAPKAPAALATSDVFQWIDELDANGCLGIGFGGGEPTLSPNLTSLCKFITETTRMAATFTTHGHHFDERLAEALKGNVHFIRISMDGVGSTYEQLRGKSFSALLGKLKLIRGVAPFGINYVVNAHTYPGLNAAITLAADSGAVEFLLLPEQPVRGSGGIDSRTTRMLQDWVFLYKGPIRLAVSEAGAIGLPICDPLASESGLSAYAHIDASGLLRRSSFACFGIPINNRGVLAAIKELSMSAQGSQK